MRAEKKFLIDEVTGHLKKSEYVILANFTKLTVSETAELRKRLNPLGAEFHVVKNSSLRVAAKALGLPELDSALGGPTAVVVGGKDSAGVAKVLKGFFKESQKVEVKAAVLGKKFITADEVSQLAELPSLEALRAQLLGLLNQPGTMLVRVLNAVPQGVVNVLQAKVRAAEGQ
jgi:large subunit ribosomal protein L10